MFSRVRVIGKIGKSSILISTGIGICLIGLVIWGAVSLITSPEVGHEVGNRASDFTLETIDGERVTLSNLRGKIVLLYLWDLGCYDCLTDMPYIQAFFKEWSKRGLVVLAINQNDRSDTETIKDMAAEEGFTFPVLLDPEGTVKKEYKLDVVPVTIFIDTNGIIQKVRPGTFGGQRQIENVVNAIQYGQEIEEIPPIIMTIAISSITESTAIVSWMTDEPTTSQVTCLQLDTSPTWIRPEPEETLVSEHSVTLSGLESNTAYQLSVASHDAFGNRATQDAGTFTTLPALPIGPEIGMRAPDFTLYTIDGEELTLSDFRGKMVMVNFWLSGCKPCVVEMPHLQAVFKNWSDEGLVILAINVRESAETVQSFIDSQGLTFPVLLDSEGVVDEVYQPSLFPTTFFIDAEGIIRQVQEGRFHSQQEIESILESL